MTAPFAALARVPGWDQGPRSTFRALSGGLTNRSYLVQTSEGDFVLRLDAPHTATFGLDRRTEAVILQEASREGIAPEIVFSDPDAGILLYRHIPGPAWQASSLLETRNLDSLAALLRKVHALPLSGTPLDTVAAASRYASACRADQAAGSIAARCLTIVEQMPPPTEIRCCHNDIVAGNIVGSSLPKLLDWEYAADNDPYFDLASPIGYHDLGRKSRERLVDAYLGRRDGAALERLERQLVLYDALQWLWLAAREVIAPAAEQRERLAVLQKRIDNR